MIKAKVKFDTKTFKPRTKLIEEINQIVERGFELAIKDFVKVAEAGVPVQTGMAKGALLPLARKYNIPIDLSSAEPKTGYLPSGQTVLKGPELGARQASRAPFIIRKGTVTIFRYSISVYHYWLRDLHSVATKKGKPTPWNTIKYGIAAFERRFKVYIRRNLSVKLVPTVVIKGDGTRISQPVETRPDLGLRPF